MSKLLFKFVHACNRPSCQISSSCAWQLPPADFTERRKLAVPWVDSPVFSCIALPGVQAPARRIFRSMYFAKLRWALPTLGSVAFPAMGSFAYEAAQVHCYYFVLHLVTVQYTSLRSLGTGVFPGISGDGSVWMPHGHEACFSIFLQARFQHNDLCCLVVVLYVVVFSFGDVA